MRSLCLAKLVLASANRRRLHKGSADFSRTQHESHTKEEVSKHTDFSVYFSLNLDQFLSYIFPHLIMCASCMTRLWVSLLCGAITYKINCAAALLIFQSVTLILCMMHVYSYLTWPKTPHVALTFDMKTSIKIYISKTHVYITLQEK
jgi:hypothetical protein